MLPAHHRDAHIDDLRIEEHLRVCERARAYGAIASLADPNVDGEVLADAQAMLRSLKMEGFAPADAFVELARALASTSVEAIREEWLTHVPREVTGRCRAPRDPGRRWACVAAEMTPDDACRTDLWVLVTLAERSVWTARLGRLELASAILDRRAEFVIEHASRCLGALADALEDIGTPVLSTTGRALAEMLGAELRCALPPAMESGIRLPPLRRARSDEGRREGSNAGLTLKAC